LSIAAAIAGMLWKTADGELGADSGAPRDL
jgi:hypothetical protein